ncbi:MAG TPA: NUDIX hydrolase [Acidocella sp.]|nr:MAG: phosphohydrolase [Acidocella sp. 20-58-15]HQT38486.1 NUDIX hydrolase [Acidocella sp.]
MKPPANNQREYPKHPLIGIGIIVLRGEEVLLIKRGRPPAQFAWSLPGGGQELGETAEAAARRELLEETGLSVGPLSLIAHVDSIHRDEHDFVQWHYTILDFAATYKGGEIVAGDDVIDIAWVHPRQFNDYDLWHEARRVIGLAVSKLRLGISLTPAP